METKDSEVVKELEQYIDQHIIDQKIKEKGHQMCIDLLKRKDNVKKPARKPEDILKMMLFFFGFCLVMLLMEDLRKFLEKIALELIQRIVKFLTNVNVVAMMGTTLLLLTTFGEQTIKNSKLKALWISPCISCAIFYCTSWYWASGRNIYHLYFDLVMLGIFVLVTLYKKDKDVGFLAGLTFYIAYVNHVVGKSAVSFNVRDNPIPLLIASGVLFLVFLIMDIYRVNSKVRLFEAGMYFWSNLFGSVTLVSLWEHHWIKYHHEKWMVYWHWIEILMCNLFILIMYIGFGLKKRSIITSSYIVMGAWFFEFTVGALDRSMNQTRIMFYSFANLLLVYLLFKNVLKCNKQD
ncbi:MAG: hypothetical protein Dasosvirus4_29 [Dasosvirus sp.]|uniref:DUF2157 domain-containing protein n=1 Tax=Dasosvirus sp. TaxID=2487764 RepID=A0A3G4ZRH8_9VIRU|nr:MAG: hypothetical protein Dasosvirus4_29 [Dasosvirus sp.]